MISMDFTEHKKSWQARLAKVVEIDGKTGTINNNNGTSSTNGRS